MRRFIHTSVLIGVFLTSGHSVMTYNAPIARYHVDNRPDLTLENLYDEIVWQGIRHPEIVFRQAMLETMWLKCTACSREFNNMFGFRTTRAYLKFNHWTESVAYYKKWQDTYYQGGNYYRFLTQIHYASAPNYIPTLKCIDRTLLNRVKEKSVTGW